MRLRIIQMAGHTSCTEMGWAQMPPSHPICKPVLRCDVVAQRVCTPDRHVTKALCHARLQTPALPQWAR